MAPPKGWKVASSNALKQRDTPMVNKREKKEKAIMRGLEDGLLWYIEGNGKEEDQLMLVILTLPYVHTYLRVGCMSYDRDWGD